MIWWVIGLSLLNGLFYRLGGTGGAWWKNTKMRDAGCPLIMLISFWLLKGFNFNYWYLYLITFGISWGVMTTYNKWASRLFGYNDGNVHWPSWLVTGAFYSLASLPLLWCGMSILGFAIRTIVLAITTMVWSEAIGIDYLEEGGRGFLYNVSMLLLVFF